MEQDIMEQDIFEEVEHWLSFIKVWEKENKGDLPDDVLVALDNALQNAIQIYKLKYKLLDLEKKPEYTLN